MEILLIIVAGIVGWSIGNAIEYRRLLRLSRATTATLRVLEVDAKARTLEARIEALEKRARERG